MAEKLCSGGIGRLLRGLFSFGLSKLALLPLLGQIPGAQDFLKNPELATWLAGICAAIICASAKKLRDSGKIPGWLPL